MQRHLSTIMHYLILYVETTNTILVPTNHEFMAHILHIQYQPEIKFLKI